MEDPVKILLEEHKLLLKAIDFAEKVQKISDDDLYHARMFDMIVFFRNFSEIYHHPKEERIFYPSLLGKSGSMEKDFLNELCDNHEDLKLLIAELENHHVMYDYRLLRFTFHKYLQALNDHIRRENKKILSVAGDLLSNKEKSAIVSKFRELDEKHGEKDELIREFQKLNPETA